MSFSKDLDGFVKKTELIQLAVVQKSAERLAIDANTDYNSGGNLPIDTSFLRSSIAAKVGSVPKGQSEKPKDFVPQNWSPKSLSLAISSMKLGDVLFIGWTAKYALKMEQRFGFARAAVQKWRQIVDQTAKEYKARINGQ